MTSSEPGGLAVAFDYVTACVVGLLIWFAALAYGAVEPWSELILLAVAGVLIALVAVAIATGRVGLRTVIVVAPLLGALVLSTAQSFPLSMRLVEALSPQRAEVVERYSGGTPERTTLSYNAAETRHATRLLGLGLAVVVATAVGVRSPGAIGLLLALLLALGVAESILSIAQQATDANGIYWSDVRAGNVRSGSLVNHSNFAQLLNLTIGASLAYFLVRVSSDWRLSSDLRPDFRTAGAVFQTHGWVLICVALQCVAIAASHSRAGVVAMGVAGCVWFVLATRSGPLERYGWAMLVVAPLAFVGLVWFGFDPFYERLGTLNEDAAYADRRELGLATIRAGLDHSLVGAGLGAHQYVFPAYDTTGSVAFAEQADNDYAQLFEETGIVGCLLVASFGLSIAWTLRAALVRGEGPLRLAPLGVIYGLIAISIQSVSDFGQRVPAVFCTSAALIGLAMAIAEGKRQATGAPARLSTRGMIAAALFALAATAVWSTAVATAARDYRANRWAEIAYSLEQDVRDDSWNAPPATYVDMIAAAEQAAQIRPERVEHHFWLNAYRWQGLLFATSGAGPNAEGAARASAVRIAEELAAARALCPTYGPVHTLEGQVRTALGEPEASTLIQQGVVLAPNDPGACLAAGIALLDARPADTEGGLQLLRRAIALDLGLFAEAADAALRLVDDPTATLVLANNDPGRLRTLARLAVEAGIAGDFAEGVRAEADRLQEQRVRAGQASPRETVELARRLAARGDHEEAITLYRKALAADFGQFAWRLSLLQSFVALDRYEEALREARICLRLKPGSQQALDWIGKLVELTAD